jgi:hypothetical protein
LSKLYNEIKKDESKREISIAPLKVTKTVEGEMNKKMVDKVSTYEEQNEVEILYFYGLITNVISFVINF